MFFGITIILSSKNIARSRHFFPGANSLLARFSDCSTKNTSDSGLDEAFGFNLGAAIAGQAVFH